MMPDLWPCVTTTRQGHNKARFSGRSVLDDDLVIR